MEIRCGRWRDGCGGILHEKGGVDMRALTIIPMTRHLVSIMLEIEQLKLVIWTRLQ